LQQLDAWTIAHLPERAEQLLAIVLEGWVQETTHILEHDGSRLDLIGEADRFREQVTLILGSELFACYGERRTRDPASQKLDATVWKTIEPHYIAMEDVPSRSVGAERGATGIVDLHECFMLKPSTFQSQ